MSDVLRVKWTIVPQTPPQPLLHCSRCRRTRSFRSSDKIRVNANGKRIDAWLIYRCTSCNDTWNRPVLERRPVQSIDPLFLTSLRVNDAKLARRLAFDVDSLKRWTHQLEVFNDVAVLKEVLWHSSAPTYQLDICCAVPHPVTHRVDRLLAAELQLARSRILSLEENGELTVFPRGSRGLRGSVRDGMRLTVSIPTHDANLIVAAAKSNAPAR